MDLSLIIVSYNTADLLEKCLRSVMATHPADKEVFVVDNASADGSTNMVRVNFPSCQLAANTENRGFAAANNQVLPQCRGRYIFFLNPDTEVMPDTFREAFSFMEANPRCGLAGVRVVNPDGSRQDSVSIRYPGEKYTRGELAELKGRIACVLGAGMIARSEVIKEVGGFDQNFFLYGEDQDLCLRIRKAGYEIGYIPSSLVIHLGAQSERTVAPADVWRKKINAEYFFYHKHYLPETIRRITRADRIKSCWRIITITLLLPFMRKKDRAEGKLIKYRTIYNELKDRP